MVKSEQGYLIIARSSENADYLTCARVLAKSIKLHMPESQVCLVTDIVGVSDAIFDYVRPFPYDVDPSNPFAADWQAYWASPFRYTIKLEADMIVTRDISHWWHFAHGRDLVISTGAYDFRGNVATSRAYRKVFDDNNLPDTYNAITYWRLSDTARDFFSTLSIVFAKWHDIQPLLKFADKDAGSTDLMYAITAQILGPERFILPTCATYPRITHMKPRINNLEQEDWTKELVWELTEKEFRINTISQQYPVHYYIKDLAKELEPIYDRLLGSNK